jgi:DNA-directed RNA polymerase subunit RPC12/RpoP
MAEEQRYLHHCDRCGELFQSKQLDQKDIRCETCGEHPVKPKFAAVTEMPVAIRRKKKDTHGIPGADKADIYTINKNKTRINLTIICLMWVFGLAVIALMANRVSDKAKALSKADVELDEEDRAYLNRKNEALQKCATRFNLFADSSAPNSKSAHILNGSDLILDINRYYNGILMKSDLSGSRIVEYDFIENGEQPKMVILYKYHPHADQIAKAYEFEVIFWKKGEDWFIDWPNFVRLGDMNWFRFNENKKKNSPTRFKLYARELSARSIGFSGYEEYKFSEAYNNSLIPNGLSKSVFVKNQTTLKSTLTSKFSDQEQLRKRKVISTSIIGNFDPPRTIRLDVTIDFKEIEGQTVIELQEIHKLDWVTPTSQKD